jgi:ceramide glucosyltransferase
MIAIVLGVLVAASWAYWLLAWAAVRRVFRRPAAPPGALPPVSLLKPVRGVDPGVLENFLAFCRQDYPGFEVVFGVADPDDPVIPLLERLRDEVAEIPIWVVVAPARGPNRKASLLEALARAARHDVLVVTDSDMRVDPSYLRRVVATLERPGVGLVTCPYVGEEPATVAARLEALHMGVTFLPSAVVAAEIMRMPFAMGATMALRREDLERIGGFAVLEPYLADDYQLGARVAALGRGVALCPYPVRSVLGATRFREQWDREVRWSRCTRASRFGGYVGYAVTFSTPLALALLLATGGGAAGWAALGGSLALRWLVALGIARETGDVESRRSLLLLPVRDVLTAATWGAALVGRRVVWRGETFDVDGEGRLVPRRSGGKMTASTAP